MTEAEKAFAIAEKKIEQARLEGAGMLSFNDGEMHALNRLPDSTGSLKTLETLNLNQTQVSDLTPLLDLTALQDLNLNQTQVSDLAPLRDATDIYALDISDTPVSDLRIILKMPRVLDNDAISGVWFNNTAFSEANEDTKRLSLIGKNIARTTETVAYLRSLPPYPDPLPWEGAATSVRDAKGSQAASIHTAQTQITMLIAHAAVSKVSARMTADQIRFVLRDVPAKPGSNALPDVLQTAVNFAQVLDNAATALEADSPEEDLRAQIALLEERIDALSKALLDAEARAEAAAALPDVPEQDGDKASSGTYKSTSGEELAKLQFWLIKAGVIGGGIQMLGWSNPIVQALLKALG